MVLTRIGARLFDARPSNDDKRTRAQKQKDLKKVHKSNWLARLISSERRERIKERLEHYESTGNERKAAIYRSKLNG